MSAPEIIVVAEAVAVDMTRHEAEMATLEIKSRLDGARRLIIEMHERRGFVALGYSTFEDYLTRELGLSRTSGYQLLDHARVVAAIEEHAPSAIADTLPNQAQSRELAPLRDDPELIAAAWTAAVAAPEPTTAKTVRSFVAKERPRSPKVYRLNPLIAELEAQQTTGNTAPKAAPGVRERNRQREYLASLCSIAAAAAVPGDAFSTITADEARSALPELKTSIDYLRSVVELLEAKAPAE